MSGYAGVIRFEGGVIDRELFGSLAESLRFRGPDRQGSWIGEQAAFAHSLLATTPEAQRETQPLERGGVVFAGDLRIDGREATNATDPELVLDAYERWGDALCEHLIGDFSFVLWDERRRRLLCARDRFARRPLYYARHEGALLVTNNLPTLLAIPALAAELDERAVADFLLFGRNLHAERTTYARISRVPAAHLMIATQHGTELRRYWSLPQSDEPRRLRPEAVYEEFRGLFSRAVADRARSERIVVALSGGLDSNAVASTLTRQRTHGVSAITTVWNELFHDEEGRYAELAAKAYGIPIEFHVADRCEPFERWDDPRVRGLEPTDEPCSAPFFDFIRRIAATSRVVLTGEGGDPVLYASHDYFFRLLKRVRWIRFMTEAAGYALTRRRRPPLCVRSQLRLALGGTPPMPDYPTWIDPDLDQRLGLRERWREIYVPSGPPRHPFRNEAWRILDSASWSRTFEAADAGATGHPVEWLSPYLDTRLVEFLFTIPPMPHFANKDLVREALRGWLPEEIRQRPKTHLPTDPAAVGFAATSAKWASAVADAPHSLGRYVSGRILCESITRGSSTGQYGTSQQAFAVGLGIWLSRRKQ